jgi:hypothetical protein
MVEPLRPQIVGAAEIAFVHVSLLPSQLTGGTVTQPSRKDIFPSFILFRISIRVS